MHGGQRDSLAIADGSSKENEKRHMQWQETRCRCSAGTRIESTASGADSADEVLEMR
jgi:hypothetical protein